MFHPKNRFWCQTVLKQPPLRRVCVRSPVPCGQQLPSHAVLQINVIFVRAWDIGDLSSEVYDRFAEHLKLFPRLFPSVYWTRFQRCLLTLMKTRQSLFLSSRLEWKHSRWAVATSTWSKMKFVAEKLARKTLCAKRNTVFVKSLGS